MLEWDGFNQQKTTNDNCYEEERPPPQKKSDFHIHTGTAGYTELQYYHGIIISVVFVKKKNIVNLNQTEIKYQY